MAGPHDVAVNARVRDLRPDDYPRMNELFEVCFGYPRRDRHWEWLYAEPPCTARTFVLEEDGRILYFMGSIRFEAWIDGRRARLNRSGDAMNDPSIRGITEYKTRFIEPMTSAGKDVEVSYSFPSEVTIKAVTRLHEKGFAQKPQVSGELSQWVRWQSGRAVHADAPRVPAVVGAAGGALVRAVAACRSVSSRRRPLHEVALGSFDDWAARFDDLAERSQHFAPALLVRDAAFVRWRWLQHPDGDWKLLVAPSDDGRSIDGYIVFAVRAGQGRIVDLLATDAATMRGLVHEATRRLARQHVERVLFELIDARPWAAKVLRGLGYLPRGRGPVVSTKARADWVPDNVRDLSNWYLTLADTDHI